MYFHLKYGKKKVTASLSVKYENFEFHKQKGGFKNEVTFVSTKEGHALIPGTERRPADILIPGWCGGRNAALDVTVIHPLQDGRVRTGAATTPGFALTYAYNRKVRQGKLIPAVS